jgi:hypothetical protein
MLTRVVLAQGIDTGRQEMAHAKLLLFAAHCTLCGVGDYAERRHEDRVGTTLRYQIAPHNPMLRTVNLQHGRGFVSPVSFCLRRQFGGDEIQRKVQKSARDAGGILRVSTDVIMLGARDAEFEMLESTPSVNND